MLNLSVLENAFAKIEKIGQDEETFEVEGVIVTMRILRPDEQQDASDYASVVLAEVADPEDRFAVNEAFAKMAQLYRVAALSYALIRIGDLDLRKIHFVETGEVNDQGLAVKMPRALAVRAFVERWTAPLQQRLFAKYVELIERMEKRVESSIKFEPVDFDVEIDRLKARIAELEEKKKPANSFTDQVRKLGGEATSKAPEVAKAKQPDPVRVKQPDLVEESSRPEPRKPLVPSVTPPPVEDGSFIDTSNVDEIEAANVAAWRARQLKKPVEISPEVGLEQEAELAPRPVRGQIPLNQPPSSNPRFRATR